MEVYSVTECALTPSVSLRGLDVRPCRAAFVRQPRYLVARVCGAGNSGFFAVVGDFDHLEAAAFGKDLGARDVGVRINARENGPFGLAIHRIHEDKSFSVGALESQGSSIGFFPGRQIRSEVAETKFDSIGFLKEGEKFDEEGFVVLDEPESAEHQAGFGGHPELFGDAGSPIAAPPAFEPSKVG